MKTYVSTINGNKYLYAYDTIYIGHGVSRQKTKSLGRVNKLAGAQEKKIAFAKHLMKQETLERTEYWSKKTNDKNFNKYVSIKEIEELRTNLYRLKKDIGSHGVELMEQAFMIDFIFNSNKLEGSKVPHSRVRDQVQSPTKKLSDEVRNTLNALNYVNSEVFKMSLPKIIELHAQLLAHEPKKIGIRKEAVVVHNSPVLDWKEIKDEMKKLLNWYKEEKHKMYPPKLAFDFYYKFERIHPFIDGNGRIGRLILNRILKENRYHPIIIWNENDKAHISAFEKRMDGQSHGYYKFMAEQFIKTHEIYLNKINKAIEASKLHEYFLSPSN